MKLPSLNSARAFNGADHYMHRLDGVAPPTTSQSVSPRYWVLSRGLYAIRVLDLKDIPADKRAAALSLAAAGWNPFAQTRHYIITQSQSAILCAWDQQTVANAQALYALDAADVNVVPETALRESALPDITTNTPSISLSACMDGMAATAGSAGRMMAEQWWPDTPSTAVWQNFQRSVGLSPASRQDAPPLQMPAWRRAPIGYIHGAQQSATSSRERWALAIAAWILVLPTLWFANQWWQLNQRKAEAIAKLATTERELNATLGARGQAMASLDRASKLANLFAQPDNLTLFAIVQDVLVQTAQSKVLQLSEWDQRGAQLKLVFTAPAGGGASAATLVKAFEQVSTFRDVEVNIDGTRTIVNIRIVAAGAGK